MKRLSEFHGLDVYSLRGEYVGKVEDVILNLEGGGVMGLSLRTLHKLSRDPMEVRRVLREEVVSYDNVSAVGEIVLVKAKPSRKADRRSRRGMGDEELTSISEGRE
jgi:sporulation protein YlmC with PRC-barrel domain